MADRYSNWPPEGTAAYFSATGGSIGAANEDFACLTGSLNSAATAGTCTATWRSQNPRPMNGRVTVTSTSQGEDGIGSPIGNITPLSASLTLIMSADAPTIDVDDISLDGRPVSVSGGSYVLSVAAKSVSTLAVVVRDLHDQPMPNGTTIALSVADAGSVSGTSSWTVPCMTDDGVNSNTYTFRIKAADNAGINGSAELKVTVTVPGGSTLTTVIPFIVQDDLRRSSLESGGL